MERQDWRSSEKVEQMLTSQTNERRGLRFSLRFWRREDGQSLVEFALSLPMLLLVVTGVFVFGVVLFQYMSINQAAQCSLRQLVVSRGQITDPCAIVTTSVNSAMGSVDQSKLTITLTLNGTTYTGTSCTSASASMILGASARVNISYPAKIMLAGNSISSGFTMTAQEQDKIQ
jgi:Flp pilus assembly protein TadG